MTPGSVARAAFVALPVAILQAVVDKKISRDAGWLYACLMFHLNRKRGGNDVWPKRETLAEEMGFAKAASVDKSIAELRDAGFILVTHKRIGRMKTRNTYTLLVLPDHSRSPQTGTSELPAETHETAAQHDVPVWGLRSPQTGTRDVPKRGPEPYEVQPQEKSSSGRGSDVKFLTALLGATDEESLLIIKEIKTMPAVRNPSAYLRGMKHDDLRELLNNIRTAGAAETSRRELSDHRARTATLPDCDHGYPGGHELSPSGWCTCPTWRVHLRKQRDPYDEPQDPRVTELVGGWSQ